MKKYTIKNYKGNLVESLKKFSEKYEGMRITEAKVKDGELKVTAEAEESMPVIAINFYGTNKNKEQGLKGALWIKESDIEGEPNADKSTDYKDEIIDKVKKFIEDCGFNYASSTYEQVSLNPSQVKKFKELYRAKICEVKSYDGYNDDDYDDAIGIDSNYGDFCVELYKDHYGDPIRKDFDNFKDAFKFADSKTKSKQYEAILITVTVIGGPLVTSSYDNIHSCWVGRTN